jgi:hypothetical protein
MTRLEFARSAGSARTVLAPFAGEAPNAARRDMEDAPAASQSRLQVLRNRGEIEPFRDFWTACRPGGDCDLDFYLFVTEQIEGCLRPHVLVLFEDNAPKALLAGRIDVGKIAIKAGYMSLPAPNLRVLRIMHGGALGDITQETSRTLVSGLIAALAAGEADAAMLESLDIHSPLVASARLQPSWLCADPTIQPVIHRFRNLACAAPPLSTDFSKRAQYRQRQRASKLTRGFGDVAIRRFATPAELPELIALAEEVTKTSYQRGIGVGFARDQFIESRLAFEAGRDELRGFALLLDGKPCAFWIGSLRSGVFVSAYLAFDPAYADYSPGMYLLMNAMDMLVAETPDLRQFDFGIGDAAYKEHLSNAFIEETVVYMFAPRWKPLAVNALRSAVGVTTRFVKRARWLAPLTQELKRRLRKRAAQTG